MKHLTKKASAAGVATVVALVGLGASGAAAAGEHAVYKSDFISGLSDTRATGAFGFGPKGLVLSTQGSTSTAKIAEYFAPKTAVLPTTASQDWVGTSPEPGKQIVFDYDHTTGNGNDYNILVGEPAYGENWWLTNGSSAQAKQADPSGVNNSGNGSDYFGTLTEWKAAMPDAKVYAYGFSLGSGIDGDGVLKSQTYGDDTFVFTETPGETHTASDLEQHDASDLEQHDASDLEQHTSNAKPTGSIVWSNQNRLAALQLKTNPLPANNRGAGKVTWLIKVDGISRFSSNQGFGEYQNFRWAFSKKGGAKRVQVLRNGVVFSTRFVTTK